MTTAPATQSLPVIDISALSSDNLAARHAVAAEIGVACRDTGFFYIKNHGIYQDLLASLHRQAKRLYALPEHEKMAMHIKHSSCHRGYVPPGEEGFYGGDSNNKPGQADFKEGFDLAMDLPADDPDYLAGNRLLGPNVWPPLPGFEHEVKAYYEAVLAVGRRLFRAFALALELPEDYFDGLVSKPTSQLRLLHFPEREKSAADQMGISAHTDYECFTILHSKKPGLQVVNRHNEWVDAPPIDGTFYVNLGDMMETWTNGEFVATRHRVIAPAAERYSFPLFYAVNYDTVVEPLPVCVSDDNPPRYEPVVAGEHLLAQTIRTFNYLQDELARGDIQMPASARELHSFGPKERGYRG